MRFFSLPSAAPRLPLSTDPIFRSREASRVVEGVEGWVVVGGGGGMGGSHTFRSSICPDTAHLAATLSHSPYYPPSRGSLRNAHAPPRV